MLSVVLVAALVVPAFLVSRTCMSSLPPNLDAGLIKPLAVQLLHRSPMFRGQCMRIAAAPRVRIRIALGTPDERTAHAETRLERYEAGAIRAEIVIRFSENYPEMLGHELEHVIELMDGLKFSAEHAAGRAWLSAAGSFETERARAAGARVQEEFDASAPETAKAERRHAPGSRLRKL